jgi:hypothetical protein
MVGQAERIPKAPRQLIMLTFFDDAILQQRLHRRCLRQANSPPGVEDDLALVAVQVVLLIMLSSLRFGYSADTRSRHPASSTSADRPTVRAARRSPAAAEPVQRPTVVLRRGRGVYRRSK